MNNEIWKPVVGYEGIYEVSNRGRVKSLPRVTTTSRIVKGRLQQFSWKVSEHILKYGKRSDDYPDVPLTLNGVSKNVCVHTLVAEAFLPNPDHLPVVNHKDGNKKNNCVENLEWTTYRNNNLHAVYAKLNTQAIPVICETNGNVYPSYAEAERLLNLSTGSICTAIKHNRAVHGYTFKRL